MAIEQCRQSGKDQTAPQDLTFEKLLEIFPPDSLTIEDLQDYRKVKDTESNRLKDRLKRDIPSPTPNLLIRDTFLAQRSHPLHQELFINRIRTTAENYRKANQNNGNSTH